MTRSDRPDEAPAEKPPRPQQQGDGQEAGAARPRDPEEGREGAPRAPAPEQGEPPRPHGDPNAPLVPGHGDAPR